MNPLLMPIFGGLIDIGKELITDKDKQIEYAFKTQELMMEFGKTLIETKTNPFVDGLVKLAYALQIFWRPAFSVCIFVWGILNPESIQKLHELGTVGDMAIGAIFGSAPAWGYSRHVEKQKKIKKNPEPIDAWDDDDGD